MSGWAGGGTPDHTPIAAMPPAERLLYGSLLRLARLYERESLPLLGVVGTPLVAHGLDFAAALRREARRPGGVSFEGARCCTGAACCYCRCSDRPPPLQMVPSCCRPCSCSWARWCRQRMRRARWERAPPSAPALRVDALLLLRRRRRRMQ